MLILASLLVALRFAAGVLSADVLMVDTLAIDEARNSAAAAGLTVDVVTAAVFNSMTTQDFSAYKALVFGEPYCNSDINTLSFLEVNKDAWSSAVTGNIVLLGMVTTRQKEPARSLS